MEEYKGIWKFKEIRMSAKDWGSSRFFSLGEADTETNAFVIDSNKIFLKREDLNPTGSWKDRGTAYKISALVSQNITEAVIASSGNAAISFLAFANLLSLQGIKFKLHIVVSPNINLYKKEKLNSLIQNTEHQIYFEKNAKAFSSKLSAQKKVPFLKTSIDEEILIGYWSLGFEIFKLIKHQINEENVLIAPASSGTALVGLTHGLFSKVESESKMPKIVVCQTQSCHPLIDSEASKDASLADAIVDKSMLRKPQVENIINKTNGKAVLVTNSELNLAKEFAAQNFKLTLSYTSLLSVATYLKIKDDYKNANFILITSGT